MLVLSDVEIAQLLALSFPGFPQTFPKGLHDLPGGGFGRDDSGSGKERDQYDLGRGSGTSLKIEFMDFCPVCMKPYRQGFSLVFLPIIVFQTLDQFVECHGDGTQNDNGSDHHVELENL